MYSNDNGIERIAVVVAEQTSIITQNASCVGGGGLFTREAQSELVTIKKTPYLCSCPPRKILHAIFGPRTPQYQTYGCSTGWQTDG